jgi:hypothetical protein
VGRIGLGFVLFGNGRRSETAAEDPQVPDAGLPAAWAGASAADPQPPGPRMRVGSEPTSEPAVRLEYRGKKYFVTKDDVPSKTNLRRVVYQFSLQAASPEMTRPRLTPAVR